MMLGLDPTETRELLPVDLDIIMRLLHGETVTADQDAHAGRRPAAPAPVEGGDVKEMIDFINEASIGAIGTVEDARAQVQRLWDQSGGFGAMLLLAHEWANPLATRRSFELIAQHVMPHFQGDPITHAQATRSAKEAAAGKREDYAAAQLQAVATMTERYQQEVATRS